MTKKELRVGFDHYLENLKVSHVAFMVIQNAKAMWRRNICLLEEEGRIITCGLFRECFWENIFLSWFGRRKLESLANL